MGRLHHFPRVIEMTDLISTGALTIGDLYSLAKKRLSGQQLRELYFLIGQILGLFENSSDDENCVSRDPYREGQKFNALMDTLRILQENLRRTMAEKFVSMRDYNRELNNMKAEIVSKYVKKHLDDKDPNLASVGTELIDELHNIEVLFNELKKNESQKQPFPY
jgi:hypothetical protein